MFNEKNKNTKTFTYTVYDSEENAVDLVDPIFTIYAATQTATNTWNLTDNADTFSKTGTGEYQAVVDTTGMALGIHYVELSGTYEGVGRARGDILNVLFVL